MRRILLPGLHPGEIDLPPSQAHHVREVLRLGPGDQIEVFDPTGKVANARIIPGTAQGVRVLIEKVDPPVPTAVALTVAAALPKGPRADWMIEKLSELGTDRFIPLQTDRSVVIPKGSGKQQRWMRLAEESAKQCGRNRVMCIDPLVELPQLVQTLAAKASPAWYLSIAPEARSILQMVAETPAFLTLLIGPEGGWTPSEIEGFMATGVPAVRLTPTTLRVETAAIAAAAIARIALTQRHPPATIHANAPRTSS